MESQNNTKNSPPFLPPFFKKKQYSTSIYCGFPSKRTTWSNLTQKEQSDALKKDWYVRWSFRNPKTGLLERQKNIYGPANSEKNRRDRLAILKTIKLELDKMLENGYNPYTKENSISHHSVSKAIDKAMQIKKRRMSEDSYTRFKSDIKKFRTYLAERGFNNKPIESVTKSVVQDYLNFAHQTVSSRSRNNYRANISSLWKCMENEEMVEKNFVESIEVLKSVPKRNKTWTDEQVESILSYLQKNNPRLLLVVEFVSYNFLRPKEVMRLKVSSINLNARTLTVQIKGGKIKTRRIPEIMISRLPDISGHGPDIDIIGKNNVLEIWDISIESKRGSISREFKLVKDRFGLGEEYGIYSFRHYYVTKLYRKLRESMSPFEAKSKLMTFTGHETMTALEKYLRTISAELAEDHSKYL